MPVSMPLCIETSAPRAVLLAAIWFVCGAACANAQTAGGLSAKNRERVEVCGSCHGPDGNSVMDKVPSLAGQPEFFILNQLVLMRDGVRKVKEMADIVKELEDGDIQELAGYYSKLPVKQAGAKPDAALMAKGKPIAEKYLCASCHGKNLEGVDQIPRLSGQRIDYMIEAMRAYKTDKRPGADTNMAAAIASIQDADLAALAHYVSGQ